MAENANGNERPPTHFRPRRKRPSTIRTVLACGRTRDFRRVGDPRSGERGYVLVGARTGSAVKDLGVQLLDKQREVSARMADQLLLIHDRRSVLSRIFSSDSMCDTGRYRLEGWPFRVSLAHPQQFTSPAFPASFSQGRRNPQCCNNLTKETRTVREMQIRNNSK